MQAHCPKCRIAREISDPQQIRTSDGKPLVRGICAICGSTLMRLGTLEPSQAPPHAQSSLPRVEPIKAQQSPLPESKAPAVAHDSEPKTPARRTRKTTAEKPKRATRSRKKTVPVDETGDEAPDAAWENQPSVPAGSSGAALVIVESPAKAKTIGKFLGRNFRVRASVGHIRDLPIKKMGVDLEHDFKPQYEISVKKRDIVHELKDYARDAREIYLATDPDREGEAISWHLATVLKPEIAGKPVRRVEFHEITRDAIQSAFAHPRQIEMDRVNAQQARRVLDRIVGYTISPLLGKKVKSKLSAGRVQSVAVRLVVEREREIQNFVPVEYWSIEAELEKRTDDAPQDGARRMTNDNGAATDESNPSPVTRPLSPANVFRARLVKVAEQDFECHTGEDALRLKTILEQCDYRVREVRRKDVTRNPNPPYITSTLQQDASRRLGFNPKRTMKVAQELYEGLDIGQEGTVGLITYMRTDSTNVAEPAQKQALEYIEKKFGREYLPPKPRVYSKKVAGAQEAHEAIRPTDSFREPDAIRQYLDNDQYKLYDLIWKRFIASQMASAIFDTTAVDIEAKPTEDGRRATDEGRRLERSSPEIRENREGTAADESAIVLPAASPAKLALTVAPYYLFRANGSILKFAGYLAVYGRTAGDPDEETDDASSSQDKRLPPLAPNEPLNLLGIYPEQHFTEPPPRYTEATLIKALEQHGIGRPSTYAPILSNVQERGYIEQIESRRLKPTELGFVVNDLLVQYFTEIVDLGFTAQMEEKLDAVEEGKQDWVNLMREFYDPFKLTLDRAAQEMPITRVKEETSDQLCDKCGSPMLVKRGKYGKFLACSAFPNCRNIKPMTNGVKCPKCKQGEVRERRSKKGRTFYGCSRYPDCDFVSWDKPLPEPCPNCGGLLVQNAKGAVRCVNNDYTREKQPEAGAAQSAAGAG